MTVPFGQIPADFTRPQRQIVRVFIELRTSQPAVGSSMCRQIAVKLDYQIDKNGSCEYVRRVVDRYLQQVSAHGLNESVTAGQ